jgi:LCP family protein required for cell wall assembly
VSGPADPLAVLTGRPEASRPPSGASERSATVRALTVAGLLLLGLLVAGAGAALWFKGQLDANIERLGDPFAGLAERPQAASGDAGTDSPPPVNILVLGSDSRISAGDPAQWEAGAQRTDAIMLVHLAGDRQSAQVVSVPRDSWVPIPGHGEAKINAAYSFGGPPLLIETFEDLTGVRIDHFVVTDFESFTAMTDALGGVTIHVPEGVSDGPDGLFPAGDHFMSGEQALEYTRQRYGLPGGDFDRVQRQQSWMRAIMGQVGDSLTDPGGMKRFLEVVSGSVAADDGLTTDRMLDLLLGARDLRADDVAFLTAPYAGTGRSADGQSIVLLDRDRLDPLMAAIAADDAAAYVRQNAGELEILPGSLG